MGVVLYPCAPVLNPDGTVSTPATTVWPGWDERIALRWSGSAAKSLLVRLRETSGVGPAQIAAMDNVCSTVTTGAHGKQPARLGPGRKPAGGECPGDRRVPTISGGQLLGLRKR